MKDVENGDFPRLPLKGNIDLTYRCNNNCRHCWLQLPENAPEKAEELTLDEIRRIADEARAVGTRQWGISGGEPMLRPDFPDIFDYLTRRSVGYSLNTNGTLITPEIAQLLKRKGSKMIALYGATPDVYDRVARRGGAFEEAMRGFAMMKEAGAGFIVQLVPMRSNWHQWDRMIDLAESLSPDWRVGASWLYLSADGSSQRNAVIAAERLDPRDVSALDQPIPSSEDPVKEIACGRVAAGDDRLFAGCVANRREFHIDPYGGMSICEFIKDPVLRFPLRSGSFKEAWEAFIPSLAEMVYGGAEYREKCGACEKRPLCRWCPGFAYLETGRYSAPILYKCGIAEENARFRKDWEERHRRYFQIAGITVQIESDMDFTETPFPKAISEFAATGPGNDNVVFHHHFEIPDLEGKDLGQEVYRKAPWAISKKDGTWFYRGISSDPGDPKLHHFSVFNTDHTRATIYTRPADGERFHRACWPSLSLLVTDQIWLAPVLADRDAFLVHSAAMVIRGSGLLFVGHSGAGKTTISNMFRGRGTILCDDRNIVRRWRNGWRVHGTWSHGDVEEVSKEDGPLRAVLFLAQDTEDSIVPLVDRKEIWLRLLPTIIRGFETTEWWRKTMNLMEDLVNEAPCYVMKFTKSGAIIPKLEKLILGEAHTDSGRLGKSSE